MTLNSLEKAIALQELKGFRKMFADYEADVEQFRKEHPKYTYPRCIHGTSRWTDYDNICGYCEEGYGWWDYQTFASLAVQNAKSHVEYAHKIFKEAGQFSAMADDKKLSDEAREGLENLAQELVEKGSKYLNSKLPTKK